MNNVLKYPGSKWNIANEIIKYIPEHHSYVEPYFGSGAVFFQKTPSNIETINDLDSNVTNLFRCIREDAQHLAKIVLTIPYSREEYDKQYETLSCDSKVDAYERAAGFLIQCWQGHGFRTNGYKVGWKNDVQARERMYALWNWYRLPEWIIEIAERLRTVQIENRPALEVIERFNYDNVFMYIDPPYLLQTRTGKQYLYEMTDEEHEVLLNSLKQSRAKIMISGYESELYNDLLSGWNKQTFSSCAEHGKPRTETIWMNYAYDTQYNLFTLLQDEAINGG